MRVCDMPEYVVLVDAVRVSKSYDQEQAEFAVDNAIIDIEQGDESYASAARKLRLHVNPFGHCGFDAADYLSCLV
jgi:hypothetical protein